MTVELESYIDSATEKYITDGLRALDSHEETLVSVWMLEAEVNNGGFHQFYWNSSGELAVKVVGALERIGAYETAEIVKSANSLLTNSTLPENRVWRQTALEDLEKKDLDFESHDERFYSYPCDLLALMVSYFESNVLQ